MNSKVKSFTLSELLVAMIITVIVVGLAFTVLNLVTKQITVIQKNYNRSTELAFFKQRIWLDFNANNEIVFNEVNNQLILKSDFDLIYYDFKGDYVLRNHDTLRVKIQVEKLLFQGKEITKGYVDAVSFLEEKDVDDSIFFVFKDNDATFFMNQDGF